jgi:hypothetical protein
MGAEFAAWSKLLRENFTICLLATMYGAVFAVVVHMAHDGRDADTIGWVRESQGLVAGALLGMLTKSAASGRGSGEPAATTTTTTTVRAEGGPVPAIPPVTMDTTVEAPPKVEPEGKE